MQSDPFAFNLLQFSLFDSIIVPPQKLLLHPLRHGIQIPSPSVLLGCGGTGAATVWLAIVANVLVWLLGIIISDLPPHQGTRQRRV
ncbi:unnamed protein product [Arabidopsis thaliana]|uniref:(thale cress) hypothetical protein n=1 Tax=Arabidopsis thaliana TaxID=3702 RepID=A0A7G2E9S4_ARATH|nr:unnamed protein product [Arabidopsis thaliana]